MGSLNQGYVSDEENVEISVPPQIPNPIDGLDTPKRARWGRSWEFLMSCIAMSVGLGNIWRFPFTAYENGGGAFLIPYVIILLLVGRPLYYLDMSLGQFSSKSSVKVFHHLKPVTKGIGVVQVFACGCIATYYSSLVAVILFYLVSSFTSDLPWTKCNQQWDAQTVLQNLTCIPATELSSSNRSNTISSSELWFTHEVLKEKTTIDDGIGLPDWRLTICLLVSWSCSFAVSIKGIKSSGKASYFLALFPYVVMIILLIRAVTLEGSVQGIIYFIKPDWEKILSANVWYHAVTQCFFSLNVGAGAIVMYASFNDFNQNINRDAIMVTTLDTFTSLLGGVTAFGVLGNLAYKLKVDIKDVVTTGGTALVFISYPEAISKFEHVPWVFAILFFLMLFVLGVGSLVALHNCVNTAIADTFPTLRSWKVAAATSVVGFIIGLVYVTPVGQVILTIVDFFTGTFVIFMVGVLETVTVMWCYGIENFCNDVEYMLKHSVAIFWRITWGIITPGLLIIIFIYFLATQPRLTYGRHPIPDIALICGWLLAGIAVIILVYYALKSILNNNASGCSKVLTAFSSDEWGPQDAEEKKNWTAFKKQKLEASRNRDNWLQQKANFFVGR